MKTIKTSIETSAHNNIRQITNVEDFFLEITESYLRFQENILHLDHTLSLLSPEQIAIECEKISQKRKELAVLDQQMIDIVGLVGKEIADEPIVHNYRVAFARANMACNNLYQSLKIYKCSLETETSPSINP